MENNLPETPARQPSSVEKRGALFISGSIIVAGIVIALAVLYAGRSFNTLPGSNEDVNANKQLANQETEVSLRPVSADEHIWGDINAPVKLIEFSDTECPFCKRFHEETLRQLGDTYVKEGKVAIVYRHYPLESLHTKALYEATALECAAELGGNEGFWKYTDRIFEITPSNDALDSAQLPQIATYTGLSKTDFEKCLQSGKYLQKVRTDIAEGDGAGVDATPYSFVISPTGKKYPIRGAQPFSVVKSIIDLALADKK